MTAFRKLTRDDRVTKTIGYNYDKDARDPSLDEYLVSVTPDPRCREFLLYRSCTCLTDMHANNQFTFMLGKASSGNAVFLYLLKMTLGSFCESLNQNLLSKDFATHNGINPKTLDIRTTRLATVCKNDNYPISSHPVKLICRQSSASYRSPHSNEINSFSVRAQFMVSAYKLPSFTVEDYSTWLKIETILFDQSFSENVETSLLYKMTRGLLWKQSFMNILLDYYSKYVMKNKAPKIPQVFHEKKGPKKAGW